MAATKRTRSLQGSIRLVLLGATVIFLAVLGVATLQVKLERLVVDHGPTAAIDIRYLYHTTRSWFGGEPIYKQTGGVSYPPASFAILWPAYGLLTFDHARVLWAAADLAAFAALGAMFWRAVRAAGPLAQLCAALAPISMPALADALGIGQLTIVVLPLAVGAVLLASRHETVWTRDVIAATMFIGALVKPSITAPFFVTFLIVPGRLRPAAITVAGYVLLTLLASLFQPDSLASQLRSWLDPALGHSEVGYANIQAWLAHLDWERAFAPVALFLLAGLAVVTWRYRGTDVWFLLGSAAIVARLWTYHRVYDDGLMIVPLVATARLAADSRAAPWLKAWAAVTVMLSAIVLWIPIHFHYVGSTLGPLEIRPSWASLFTATHVAVFIHFLIVLMAGAITIRDQHPRAARRVVLSSAHSANI